MRKILASVIGLLALPVGVMASPQIISEEQVQGESGGVPLVKMALNVGVPIKMPEGYKVFKGWLDNSNLAEVDGDRPWEEGASIIYLVPRELGYAKLSMMVRGPDGGDRLYVLKIMAGGKSSPDMVIVRGQLVNEIAQPNVAVKAIRSGMAIAERNGELVTDSKLHRMIEEFLDMIAEGQSSDAAFKATGVKPAVIQKLIQYSKRSNSPLPDPQTPMGKDDSASLSSPPPQEKVEIAEGLKLTDVPSPDFSRIIDNFKSKPEKVKKSKQKIVGPRPPEMEGIILNSLPSIESLNSSVSSPFLAIAKKSEPVSTHEIANRLVLGLRYKSIKVSNYEFARFQDTIYLLRKGNSLEVSCEESKVSLSKAKSLLKLTGLILS